MPTENDILNNIEADHDTKCAHWTGTTAKKKPVLYKAGRQWWMRTWVYEYRKGPVLQGFYVHMTCGNWDCVNSQHMELRPRGRRFQGNY